MIFDHHVPELGTGEPVEILDGRSPMAGSPVTVAYLLDEVEKEVGVITLRTRELDFVPCPSCDGETLVKPGLEVGHRGLLSVVMTMTTVHGVRTKDRIRKKIDL